MKMWVLTFCIIIIAFLVFQVFPLFAPLHFEQIISLIEVVADGLSVVLVFEEMQSDLGVVRQTAQN